METDSKHVDQAFILKLLSIWYLGLQSVELAVGLPVLLLHLHKLALEPLPVLSLLRKVFFVNLSLNKEEWKLQKNFKTQN